MSFVVKAQSASDLSKSPAYSQVADEEVILKGCESRSDRPQVYYHQSPRTSNSDATLPLDRGDPLFPHKCILGATSPGLQVRIMSAPLAMLIESDALIIIRTMVNRSTSTRTSDTRTSVGTAVCDWVNDACPVRF